MPAYAPNKMPAAVKRRYFELIRSGLSGSQAALRVGVSLSCGSLWFIEAGRVSFIETPISPRYLSQDDRIEIADGLDRAEPVKQIAARIGKSYQSVYREIARNRKPDGRYQPWYAHNQAYLRRGRPAGCPSMPSCATRPPASWPGTGHLRRSAGGCGAATGAGPPGICGCPGERRQPAHRPDLPSSPWPGPDARLRAQTVHGHEVDPPAARRCPVTATGRPLGGVTSSSAQRSGQRSPRCWSASSGSPPFGPRDHSAQTVADALIGVFSKLPAGLCRTLTWDQGNEMFHHQRIEQQTGLKIYFADPHSPWQRGSNENADGLLRQYFPKGTDLSVWTSDQFDRIAAELNDRPRLCLGDRTPHQAMQRWARQQARQMIRNVH
jgi:hypothetical protein